MLRNRYRKLTNYSYTLSIPKQGHRLNLEPGFPKPATCNLQPATSQVKFTFLNLPHTFKEAIDWNTNKHGKLWAYNLNYFDYLLQEDMSKEPGLKLIHEFIHQIEDNREGLEPYPISLRGMNWIKFLNQHKIRDPKIDASLYGQYHILLDNVEYHLMGNHLMENGCALLFGAYYFKDQELLEASKDILNEQLDVQVLSDGGHFERSTMYHLIMLERLLDCYNLMANNDWGKDDKLIEKLKEKVELMLGWLDKMTVDRRSPVTRHPSPVTKELPLLNDAAKGIGPEPSELLVYANRLDLKGRPVKLFESGYRRFSTDKFDLICDVGNIGPDYIPGHAHSDTLSFALYCDGKPIITDPGISTYENNDQRQLERSTAFHNTVQFGDKEQSEVWSAFRVGRRAKVYDVSECQDENGNRILSARHDGYEQWGITHKRSWTFEKGGRRIVIRDQLIGNTDRDAVLNLHFHSIWTDEIKCENQKLMLGNIEISFDKNSLLKLREYNCPDGYNLYLKCAKIEMPLVREITTYIDYVHGDTFYHR